MKTVITDISTGLDAYLEYERRKRELPSDLSPKEYEDAIEKICDELGI